ncbi:hypothetical protein NM208_g15932 [Fusarium decemcellulare]|uniref:Uncharacterized protein n=1 Tax=Fusarium decemcellulare TaxID=57161 RepID=A0ACC1RBM8_9HYPO|nr:hypothetical protein NM208_g15932 [Fusarium decemcellulare]
MTRLSRCNGRQKRKLYDMSRDPCLPGANADRGCVWSKLTHSHAAVTSINAAPLSRAFASTQPVMDGVEQRAEHTDRAQQRALCLPPHQIMYVEYYTSLTGLELFLPVSQRAAKLSLALWPPRFVSEFRGPLLDPQGVVGWPNGKSSNTGVRALRTTGKLRDPVGRTRLRGRKRAPKGSANGAALIGVSASVSASCCVIFGLLLFKLRVRFVIPPGGDGVGEQSINAHNANHNETGPNYEMIRARPPSKTLADFRSEGGFWITEQPQRPDGPVGERLREVGDQRVSPKDMLPLPRAKRRASSAVTDESYGRNKHANVDAD